VLALAATAQAPRCEESAPSLFPSSPRPTRARIAVARDRAFSFYYADSLDLLRAWGAEIVTFSPLEDEELPPGCGAVYIGGGFPEVFAAQLAANVSMHAALRRAAAQGRVIYGECGGLMYLGETLTDALGHTHTMVGLLPFNSTMSGSRLTLAYWDLTTRTDGVLAPSGRRLRGHEFHWSVPDRDPSPEEALYELEGTGRLEGIRRGSVYGSYIHLHLGSDPSLAPAFVSAADAAAR
jgi:cobyrinic acid a,c-diamide synthase